MDEKTREAMAYLKRTIDRYEGYAGKAIDVNGRNALAHLQAMAEENERIKYSLDQMTKNRDYWFEKTQNVKADLARYRRYDKLIKAAEKAPVYRHSGGAIQWPTDIEEQAILEAALSCRESPESDTVSRGKDDILGERKGK